MGLQLVGTDKFGFQPGESGIMQVGNIYPVRQVIGLLIYSLSIFWSRLSSYPSVSLASSLLVDDMYHIDKMYLHSQLLSILKTLTKRRSRTISAHLVKSKLKHQLTPNMDPSLISIFSAGPSSLMVSSLRSRL